MDSESEDDKSDFDEREEDDSFGEQIFTPRTCFSTLKGQKFSRENEITADDLEKFEEVPLTLENVMKYLPEADNLIQADLAKKVASIF